MLQGWWTERLRCWANGRGDAGPEWRFRVAPPGEEIRPLVPDVAYLSYERMGSAGEDDLEAPQMAPNVVVEVLSPDDKAEHVRHKVGVYLAAGADAVIVVDPKPRTLTIHDASGAVVLDEAAVFSHHALRGLTFQVAEMFAAARLRPSP